MNWLERLKKINTAPAVEATEPTKPGFVGFAAPAMACIQKTGVDSPAANDPAPVPDRWAWPHSQAMTGAEIDTFTARLHYFTGRGLVEIDAERLADKLVTRDRESDDRRLCLECAHLAGHGACAMRCTNWQRAGVAVQAIDARLSGALVHRLQRCDGFKEIGL
jgi:hypothetical protein